MQCKHNIRQINWELIRTHAETMTIEALEYSILDCHEAGLAALAMEQADIPVDKTQGYYLDAASIYHQELSTRQTDPLFGGAV